MSIRVGAWIFSPNTVFLGLAFVLFLMSSFRKLYPSKLNSLSETCSVLALASIGGVFLSALFASIGGTVHKDAAATVPVARTFAFQSMGGFWGVLLGGLVAGLILRRVPLRVADAMVPGILIGGISARVADVFSNAGPGIDLAVGTAQLWRPFQYWALYDIAAMVLILFTLDISSRLRHLWFRDGALVCGFLLLYGITRFALEFIREAPRIYAFLTLAQGMATVQIAAGLLLWRVVLRQQSLECNHTSHDFGR